MPILLVGFFGDIVYTHAQGSKYAFGLGETFCDIVKPIDVFAAIVQNSLMMFSFASLSVYVSQVL
jgi:hypothetical protein